MRSTRYKSCLFFLLISLVTFQTGWAKGGGVDTTFGNPEHPGFLRIGPTTMKIPGGNEVIDQLCIGDYCGGIATSYPDGRILFYMGYFIDKSFGFLRYTADGEIDKSFGAMVGVESKFGEWNTIDQGRDYATQIVIQPDEKIISLGLCTSEIVKADEPLTPEQVEAKKKALQKAKEEGGDLGIQDICLSRYNAKGSLDQTFGEEGLTVTDLAPWEVAHALALQPDGKILLGGDIPCSNKYTFPLLRYDANGKLDTTFGSEKTGIVNTSFGLYNCGCSADGSKVYVPAEVQSIVVQPDGRILASGIFFEPALKRYLAALVRLLPDGTLDTGFGNVGKVIYSPADFKNHAQDTVVLLQDDNVILIVSESWEGVMSGEVDKGTYNEHLALVRFLPNGSVDLSFGKNGQSVTEIQFGGDLDALFQTDGKVVVKTLVDLLRFNDNGTLDALFGEGGKVKLWDESIPWEKVEYGKVKLRSGSETGLISQPDGRIVVVGSARLQLNKNNPKAETGFHDGFLRFWGSKCDSSSEKTIWYYDEDKDGLGNPSKTVSACPPPSGYVNNKEDCDDAKSDVGKATSFFPDADQDGFGDNDNKGNWKFACTAPEGYVSNALDCNDKNPKIYPGAPDYSCEGIDDNCNKEPDDQYIVFSCDTGKPGICAEGKMYCMAGTETCQQTHKPETEVCNNQDDDCDGKTDESDSVGIPKFYPDKDQDTFGDQKSSPLLSCTDPSTLLLKYVQDDHTDCDDNDSAVNTDGVEICNGKDENCNGQIDEGIPLSNFFQDQDGDGFGSQKVFLTKCKQPSGFVSNSEDCNDADKTINPKWVEMCNGKDDNCNGQTDEGKLDGNACDSGEPGTCGPGTTLCKKGILKCISNTDPFGEICDGIDNNCDGKVDDADNSVTGQTTFYVDKDGDGFGNPKGVKKSCSQPAGYVPGPSADCNDNNVDINPDAAETCNNGIDDNCNGAVDGFKPGGTKDPSDGC